MNYQTDKQFEEICNSAINGNFSQAFKECVDYGFYANDLIIKFKESEYSGIKATDLAILAEGSTELRYKK